MILPVIADSLGIDGKTLTKYYREELDQALAQANASVGGALFNKATKGDTTAMIFWMKTRAGWRERQQVDHTSSDGTMTPKFIKLENLSSEALAELIAAQDAAKSD